MTISTSQSSASEFTSQDEAFMQSALTLAEKGIYTTTPNPCVGAVVVAEGALVGSGWHHKAGAPHAEIIAMQQAGTLCRGATVYVTLEPCCHQGRTGPCTDALIKADVSRVVYAMADPNPKVAGSGAECLRKAGIKVDAGLMQEQAEAINQGYIHRMRLGKPFVTLKLAASFDGRSAMASGESRWITGSAARADVQKLRARSCAIMTGSGTIAADNPRYSLRESQLGQPVERQPDLWVADTGLNLHAEQEIVTSRQSLARRVMVLSGSSAIESKLSHKASLEARGIEVLACPTVDGDKVVSGSASSASPVQAKLDLTAALDLMAQREMNRLLVEAGPQLSASMLDDGLVDEIVYYMAPKFLGSDARSVIDLPLQRLEQAIGFQIGEVEMMGEDLKITARPSRH